MRVSFPQSSTRRYWFVDKKVGVLLTMCWRLWFLFPSRNWIHLAGWTSLPSWLFSCDVPHPRKSSLCPVRKRNDSCEGTRLITFFLVVLWCIRMIKTVMKLSETIQNPIQNVVRKLAATSLKLSKGRWKTTISTVFDKSFRFLWSLNYY